MLAEITPLNFRFSSLGLVIPESFSFLCACPKVILASSFISVFSFQYIRFGLPFLHTLQLFFFLTLQFLQDPALFTPLPHRQPSVSLSLTPSSHTQCSISQAFGQGAPLSPSKTHCCDCLLLMSASPHHLGKEGKIHK